MKSFTKTFLVLIGKPWHGQKDQWVNQEEKRWTILLLSPEASRCRRKGVLGSWGLGGQKESVLFLVPLGLDLKLSPATIERNPAKNEADTGRYRAGDGQSSHDITEVPGSSQAWNLLTSLPWTKEKPVLPVKSEKNNTLNHLTLVVSWFLLLSSKRDPINTELKRPHKWSLKSTPGKLLRIGIRRCPK